MTGFINRIHKREQGITGLETAIILIAFVVVAAVFAYTVISAGMFATQKSQQAVHSGIREAQGSVEINGAVVAKGGTTGISGTIKQFTFTVSGSMGGEPMDFTSPTADGANTGLAAAGSNNVVVIGYFDKNQRVDDLYYTVQQLGGADSDYLLEDGEKFQITIGSDTAGASGGNLINALGNNLSVNTQFSIEVKTTHGGILTLERTTPAYIDSVINLY
jgi:archaeal flagellin FlaB